MSHGHSHNCGGHDSTGSALEDVGVQYSLFQKIDMDKIECLNEAQEDSGKTIFKPWDQRLDKTKFVESDADSELLFNIPFNGNVKLRGIIVIGGEAGTCPDKMRLFKNREHMTFDQASSKADQEFTVVEDAEGRIEYEPKVVQFSSVHHLTLHFPSNIGSGDETKIYYIGLKGDFTEAQRVGVVHAVYEARPMVKDHEQDIKELGKSNNFLG